ncbi:VIR protein [Plasmodium vivax]|uniref:VIR protein n=1 Tax=Plasmodium vivax TaxID=5855 RepID=A0A1G4EFL6_PLAVI|nr:VIR protein [Plasmodium vivax]
MANPEKVPEYISYPDYVKAKGEFLRTMDKNPDNERLQNIINDIYKESHKSNLNNKTFKKLHSVLSNDQAFYTGITKHYCGFINHWLNKEIQDINNHFDETYLPIFQKFSDKLSIIKTKRSDQLCNNSIFNIDHETLNIMDILYGLYDEYDKIKSLKGESYYESCNKFLLLAKNHNNAIDNYYENNIKLYNKFEHIKKLIGDLKMQPNYPCIKDIYLNEPEKVIKKRQEEEQQAIIKKRLEEEAQQAIQQERERERERERKREREREGERDRLKSVLALNGEGSDTLRGFGTTENNALSSMLHAREDGLSENSISLRGQPYLEENKFTHSQIHLLDPLARRKEAMDQSDIKNYELESNHISQTDTSGAFGSLQNTISGFIKDVDPGPVLGVSGGMGALFLLFKYTPVGSFFGGRRGRFRQIPRSFNGPFQGGFPDFQDYDVGYIGYSPMNINPLAE